MIEYTFGHATAAWRLTQMVVSTDCPKSKLGNGTAVEVSAVRASGDCQRLGSGRDAARDGRGGKLRRISSRGAVGVYGNVPLRGAGLITGRSGAIETAAATPCGRSARWENGIRPGCGGSTATRSSR